MAPLTQVTDTVLMVRPARFFSNPETATSNGFQSQTSRSDGASQAKALEEFDHMVQLLSGHGVRVLVAHDHPDPETPDSIFPNNWVSYHNDGKAYYYPMCAPNRRLERDKGFESVLREHGFHWRAVDFTEWEKTSQFLEGTGSMVLDRKHQVAYACLSPRTDPEVFQVYCQSLDYQGVLFKAWHEAAGNRHLIYHTNVMLSIGDRIAVICDESIADDAERKMVMQCLENTEREILRITVHQMNEFAGNMLELRSAEGEPLMILSARALASLRPEQVNMIAQYCRILAPDLSTIETLGGGSARCMLAEVFLPSPL